MSPALPLDTQEISLHFSSQPQPYRLRSHFQPIVSVKRKAVIGVEALARARDIHGGAVSPLRLFDEARAEGPACVLAVDRACQEAALQGFRSLPKREPELLLFLNVEASLLDQQPELNLLQEVQAAGLEPGNVVIEVNEAQVMDQRHLAEFVRLHREAGFLIAMDDLGSGHSSLQRWPLLKPDIIKLDRGLVDGLAGNFFARELVRSLISLGRQTGALILAEGVETEADVLACMELGVDFFQGYWFARPSAEPQEAMEGSLRKAQACAVRHKLATLERFVGRRNDMLRHSRQAGILADALTQVQPNDFCRVLRSLPWPKEVESVLLLDQDGQQFCPVLFVSATPPRERAGLFKAPKPGADHSDREYYYALMDPGMDRDSFLTDVHLSSASGRLCRTLSHRFDHPSGGRFVVCMEIGTA